MKDEKLKYETYLSECLKHLNSQIRLLFKIQPKKLMTFLAPKNK